MKLYVKGILTGSCRIHLLDETLSKSTHLLKFTQKHARRTSDFVSTRRRSETAELNVESLEKNVAGCVSPKESYESSMSLVILYQRRGKT